MEYVLLEDKDITELSEYAPNQFVVGLWDENDYMLVSRTDGKIAKITQPLWCNCLCTDLVPMPGYHPQLFPFFLAKSLRSITLLDFQHR